MFSLQSAAAVAAATERYGVAPGARSMLQAEMEAAREAVETGCYALWRNVALPGDGPHGDFCKRLARASLCLCGHSLAEHGARCSVCACRRFLYLPVRPEEIGDAHLVRRRGFDIRSWRPACRCKHGADAHVPGSAGLSRCATCSCGEFEPAFGCVACDGRWVDHEARAR